MRGSRQPIIFAVIGAIVGEFIGASQGLGSLIIQRQAAIDVPGVFSVLFYLSAIGIVLDADLARYRPPLCILVTPSAAAG